MTLRELRKKISAECGVKENEIIFMYKGKSEWGIEATPFTFIPKRLKGLKGKAFSTALEQSKVVCHRVEGFKTMRVMTTDFNDMHEEEQFLVSVVIE